MKLTLLFRALSLAGTALLFACSNSSSGGESAWERHTGNFYAGLDEAETLEGAKAPVLRSPGYEEQWGSPRIRVSTVGDYELNYANPGQPFDRLVIHGSVRPFPILNKAPRVSGETMVNGELTGVTMPQSFRTIMIAGRPVRWFQESTSGGADGAYYSTEGFALTDSFGNTGYYRMVVEAGDKADEEVARRFASARFSR